MQHRVLMAPLLLVLCLLATAAAAASSVSDVPIFNRTSGVSGGGGGGAGGGVLISIGDSFVDGLNCDASLGYAAGMSVFFRKVYAPVGPAPNLAPLQDAGFTCARIDLNHGWRCLILGAPKRRVSMSVVFENADAVVLGQGCYTRDFVTRVWAPGVVSVMWEPNRFTFDTAPQTAVHLNNGLGTIAQSTMFSARAYDWQLEILASEAAALNSTSATTTTTPTTGAVDRQNDVDSGVRLSIGGLRVGYPECAAPNRAGVSIQLYSTVPSTIDTQSLQQHGFACTIQQAQVTCNINGTLAGGDFAGEFWNSDARSNLTALSIRSGCLDSNDLPTGVDSYGMWWWCGGGGVSTQAMGWYSMWYSHEAPDHMFIVGSGSRFKYTWRLTFLKR